MSAETAASRRAAGELVDKARAARYPRVSKRLLAKRVNISETWYRAITTGLAGEEPRVGSDELWVNLARDVGLDPKAVFDALGRPMPDLPGADASPAEAACAGPVRVVGPEWPLREGEVLEWAALPSGKVRFHLYSTETGRGADYAWPQGAVLEDVVAWLRELMSDVDETAARMLRKRAHQK